MEFWPHFYKKSQLTNQPTICANKTWLVGWFILECGGREVLAGQLILSRPHIFKVSWVTALVPYPIINKEIHWLTICDWQVVYLHIQRWKGLFWHKLFNLFYKVRKCHLTFRLTQTYMHCMWLLLNRNSTLVPRLGEWCTTTELLT